MVKPNINAAINAIKKRILADYDTNYTRDDVIQNWLVLTESIFDSETARYFPRDCTPNIIDGVYTDKFFHRWVERFPMSTRKQLLQARTDLEITQLNRKDFSVQVITKIEKSGYIDLEFPAKDARAVNNCTPRSNVASGPYYWAFSLALKETLGKSDKWALWTPGNTSECVGEFFDMLCTNFDQVDSSVMFGVGDQSAFDGHQNSGSFNFETAMFHRAGLMGVMPAHHMGSIPHGRHQKFDIKFNAGKQSRTSGQGKTSSANVCVSFAAAVHALGHPGPTTWGGLFNGDDILIVSTTKYLKPRIDDFGDKMHQLGLEMEINWTNCFHEIEFCQTIPYPTKDGTIFAPKIGRLMARIGVSTSYADPSMKSIATGLYVTCFHVPFIRQLLDKYLQLTVLHKDTYAKDYKFHPQLNNFASRPHETTGATWSFIGDRYGLDITHLTHFQRVLDSVDSIPAVIEWPMINDLVSIDE